MRRRSTTPAAEVLFLLASSLLVFALFPSSRRRSSGRIERAVGQYNVSLVVDGHPRFYYQAQLLLFSLDHFAGQAKDSILVQFTPSVDASFLGFLDANGYRRKRIVSFLKGGFNYKMVQLAAFEDSPAQGVFMVDLDTFFLRPLQPPDPTAVCARVVAVENPPLVVLLATFEAANLPTPALTATACNQSAMTFSNNFNAGFVYVPRRYVRPLSAACIRWGRWLIEGTAIWSARKGKFADQVAMALALSETGIPYFPLKSNFNHPLLGQACDQGILFDHRLPISMLHYHTNVNASGMIGSDLRFASRHVLAAVQEANAAIAQRLNFSFFEFEKFFKA
jgi:hypothetical protein